MSRSRPKYALISGTSSGIGYALAKEFSKKGYRVFGLAPESVIHLQKPLEEQFGVISIPCDITSVADIERVVEIVKKETEYLDILYNNAGIATGAPAIDSTPQQVNQIFQVNTIGHINMTCALAPLVINAKGSIVFTSSVAARIPLSWASVYSATKAAIDSYAGTLHSELEPFGVRVHSVITGGVNTNLTANEKAEDKLKELNGSKYFVDGSIESFFEAKDMCVNHGIPTDTYAKQVVKKVNKKSTRFNLYAGSQAYLLHWMSRFIPRWLVEYLLQWFFKQLKPFRAIRKQVKEQDKNRSVSYR